MKIQGRCPFFVSVMVDEIRKGGMDQMPVTAICASGSIRHISRTKRKL